MRMNRCYDFGITILVGLGLAAVCHLITYEATSRARVEETTQATTFGPDGKPVTRMVYKYPNGYGYGEFWSDDTVRASVSLAVPVVGALGVAGVQAMSSGGSSGDRKTVTGRDGQGADIRAGDNSTITVVQGSPTTTDNSVQAPPPAPPAATGE